MKQIIALKEYSDKYISLYQGEVRNIGYELANRLIEEGIVAEHNETGNSGSSGGVPTISSLPEMIQISSTEIDGNSVEACWNDSLHFALTTHSTQGSTYMIMNCVGKSVMNGNNGTMTLYTGRVQGSDSEMNLALAISKDNEKQVLVTVGSENRMYSYDSQSGNYIYNPDR